MLFRSKRELADSDILTNATSLGMAPDTDRCPVPDASFLADRLIVSDIIYNPGETILLQMAKSKGLPCFNGLFMLLFQGAEAFRLWTGANMPVTLVKNVCFS